MNTRTIVFTMAAVALGFATLLSAALALSAFMGWISAFPSDTMRWVPPGLGLWASMCALLGIWLQRNSKTGEGDR